jgi:putative nucleotidyltransferase with HDIG domain
MSEILKPIPQSDLEMDYPYIFMAQKNEWIKSQTDLIKEKPSLYGHSIRVAYLTAELAEHVGMDDPKILASAEAGLLHDLGKLTVPDEVFNTGVLTEDEKRRLIDRHVRAGYEMIKPYLPFIAEIMVAHHEFQDRGYPRRVGRESANPELERMQEILALADETDSLLSPRSYKKAWSVEKTRLYLVNLFDKDLVDFSIKKRRSIVI